MSIVITREELVRAMREGTITLLEALPAAHYAAEHLPGAVNVPGELTARDAGRIAPDLHRTVVVYCSGPGCSRSTVTAAALTRAGYTDVRVYVGGKADWFAAGLPVERTADAS
ncbi:rhodanese-like domain-containing protein [Cellulomonas humilata]|uniref:thiosulfate sulfurtransferase n=1 Tax=Cellulomonas humilata TaxID=144055 RepID=A0A7Y5ZXE2_9CELL|nr:rhodanese-like domain-containing protein [Cellulomonas humilata]NUU15824.1 rhodanese-like domain-containing protein [Cellulomonas humilata]